MHRPPDPERPWACDLRLSTAFTLIEVLVVVGVIVILIGILVPALEKAISSSELAACGATQKGLATAGIQYASANRQAYPSRGPHDWDALQVKLVDDNSGTVVFDIPRLVTQYAGINSFIDPLNGKGKIDLNAGAERTARKGAAPTLYSNYLVYFDWGHPNSSLTSMKRIGDKLVFQSPEGDLRKFNALVADLDSRRARQDGAWDIDVYSGHMDEDGKLVQLVVQDQDNPFVKGIPLPIGKVTTSWFWGFSPPAPNVQSIRGLCDYNYALDDNSVITLKDVKIDDPRCKKLVLTAIGEYNNDRRAQLPPYQ